MMYLEILFVIGILLIRTHIAILVNGTKLTGTKEIYQRGISAATVGNTHEAITFLKIAKLKVPPTDTEYVEKIYKNLAIQSGDSK